MIVASRANFRAHSSWLRSGEERGPVKGWPRIKRSLSGGGGAVQNVQEHHLHQIYQVKPKMLSCVWSLCSVKKLSRLWHFVSSLTYNFWISWREGTARTLKIFGQKAKRAMMTRVNNTKPIICCIWFWWFLPVSHGTIPIIWHVWTYISWDDSTSPYLSGGLDPFCAAAKISSGCVGAIPPPPPAHFDVRMVPWFPLPTTPCLINHLIKYTVTLPITVGASIQVPKGSCTLRKCVVVLEIVQYKCSAIYTAGALCKLSCIQWKN